MPIEPGAVEKVEDIFEPYPFLGDYLNKLAAIQVEEGEVIRLGEVPTVEAHFEEGAAARESMYQQKPEYRERNVVRDQAFKDDLVKALEGHPEKIKMMNKLAALLNTSEDPAILMQAKNKMLQLVRGKDAALLHDEPEADPNLLET